MVLLDAYALIALLVGEPARPVVEELLRHDDCGMASVNLAESIDVMQRRHEADGNQLRAVVDPLLDGPITLVDAAVATAWRAGEIRALHYHRTRRPISLADCVLLASAASEDMVATADEHLLAVAEKEHVATVALPRLA